MLYEKSKEKYLSDELFKNPSSEYRGAPFWAWNCKLDIDELKRQIEIFKEMGFGGAHMHTRAGMATKYLSDEFMSLIKDCTDKFKDEGLYAYLYDEDRWPSGSAGGMVTKNPKYSQRLMIFTSQKLDTVSDFDTYVNNGGTYLEAVYDVCFNEKGEMKSYKKIENNEKAFGTKMYAYLDTAPKSGWFNGSTYIDTMNPDAVNEFIRITYERYKDTLKDDFGKTARSMFTDEPQFHQRTAVRKADPNAKFEAPWTPMLKEKYFKKYSEDITEHLPELFFELESGEISCTRYRFYDLITELFSNGFLKGCYDWCAKNGISFTGHLMAESTLDYQTSYVGEAMRHYRNFHIPGIDMLCNAVELDTAKQVQSAIHQYGREGGMSELYGVTDWDFDFRGHKFQGDWQAALGITLRVHHLSWASMKASAKRDYPASINYQSPWYKEYSYIENHFARINTALTRGKPVVKIGVIHPIESAWLHFGPLENTGEIREEAETNFQNLIKWLLYGNLDFDFISESLIPELQNENNGLCIGEMKYDVIVVPPVETIRGTTLSMLEKFMKQGGKVIVTSDTPVYVDAVKSDKAEKIYSSARKVSFERNPIINALSEERLVEIRYDNGLMTDEYIYNLRQDNDCKWLFIAKTKKIIDKMKSTPRNLAIKIKGEYTPLVYDTLTGEIHKIGYVIKNGNTIIEKALYDNDSLLLKLSEKAADSYKKEDEPLELSEKIFIKDVVSYTLSEENVYILDTAEYKIDDEEYMPEEEILKADQALRRRFGYKFRDGGDCQPWAIEKQLPEHTLKLRYKIFSDIEYDGAFLALEDAENAEIMLNSEAVKSEVDGWFTDKSIKKVRLPKIKKGENILEIKMPFGEVDGPEAMYLLGKFGVKVQGCKKTIAEPDDKIGFGNIVEQGLPFYGANITYKAEIDIPENKKVRINIPHYSGAAIHVKADGKDIGIVAFAPYAVETDKLKPGKHTFEFTLYGNRFNTFGAVHTPTIHHWAGGNLWYTQNDEFCYDYALRPMGILSSPVIKIYK